MIFYYVTDEILDDRSAETVHINEICKNLVVLGHTVALYAPTTETFHPQKEYETKFLRVPRSLLSIVFQVQLFFRLWHDVFSKRPDIIYSRHNHILFIPVLIGRLLNVPVVLEVNGRLLEEARHIDHSFIGRALLASGVSKFLESFNAKSVAKMVVVAQGIKDYFVKNYKMNGDRISVVPNGVDIDFFKPIERKAVRKAFALDAEALYVGYIGSFYPWQGLRYIAQAAELVLAERPDTKFLIIGKGEEADYLDSFVQEKKRGDSIKILSAVSHDLVPAYINALDICICYPTKFRNAGTSPFKVYEYLACGRPVILADIEGMREEFGDVAAYVKAESPEALAHGLIQLIDDKKHRERLGNAGRKFVEHGRSWRSVAEQIATLCEGTVKRK